MTIRTLIVDDEPIARRGIRAYLKDESDVEIIAECGNGHEAIAAIADLAPDLVFLDVQMPEVDGFGVVASIGPERMPAVIFVTAFDQYALRAFDVHALDYVLKPVDRERFRQAVEHARARIRSPKPDDVSARLLALLREGQPDGAHTVKTPFARRLVVKQPEKVVFVDVAEVDWIEAAGNYVNVHVGQREYLIRETMNHMEERLNPEEFLRIRRSVIVRVDRIKELQPQFNSEWVVLLKTGARLQSSRRYRKALDRLLGD